MFRLFSKLGDTSAGFAAAEHRAIYQALEAREPELAADRMRTHILNSKERGAPRARDRLGPPGSSAGSAVRSPQRSRTARSPTVDPRISCSTNFGISQAYSLLSRTDRHRLMKIVLVGRCGR
jgi:hypothetical protein